MLTKSDFLLYIEAPLHLWASKHYKNFNSTPSLYDQHLMKQGYEVEKIARKLLPHADWQKTYTSKKFSTRTDALIKNSDGTYDLYEVKSTTNIEKEYLFDVTFQLIVLKEKIKLDKIFIVILNKDYVRGDSLDIKSLFLITEVTGKVKKLTSEVEEMMNDVLNIINKKSPNNIENCLTPKTCPCIDLCHPNLPKKSIFNIPQLHPKKKRQLLNLKIVNIKDVSISFALSEKQRRVADVINSDKPYIDKEKLQKFIDSFKFPLHFLDYETYPLAIPLYKGFKPYQHMVFQYSLHIMDKDNNINHKEYLETETGNPTKKLLNNLKKDIGLTGSVIVWNKTFEFGRNKEMQKMQPKYSKLLNNVNDRMVDLADFVNKGYYIHPKFLGRWSIKNVFPVMAPGLSYDISNISKGDEAMLTWWKMVNSTDKYEANNLLIYCGLDTLAMVKIWEKLNKII